MKNLFKILIVSLLVFSCEEDRIVPSENCSFSCGNNLVSINDSEDIIIENSIQWDCPEELCGIMNITCMEYPDSIYVIQSENFCVEGTDYINDEFIVLISSDSLMCNNSYIHTECILSE
tara:strand:+ start:51 stop:407 length:357 start_codon:yes stop_codon:yes gene_type:complete